jgi:OmpA-OmpF porin, OOP family
MASLLHWITEIITPDAVSNIAARLGESDVSVSRGLHAGVTSVLAGLVARTGDTGLMRQVYDLASNREGEINTTFDLTTTLGKADAAGSSTSAVASRLLSGVFGGRLSDVDGIVTRAAGFEKPSSGASIVALAVPIVLGFLGPRIRERGLELSAFTSMLASQRDTVLDAAPVGIRGLVDSDPGSVGADWPPNGRRAPVAANPPRIAVTPPKNRWLWPVISGIAAVALLWALLSRTRPEVSPTLGTAVDSAAVASRSALDSTAAAAARVLDSAAGTVSSAVRNAGEFVKRTLPSGIVLNVRSAGIESRLVAFIEDRSRSVNDTTWFDFDRLNFATGSATILPESQEQLDNIAEVLRAYPNVTVKVGGYTDNTGDPAANMRLSQSRAESVRTALIGRGIGAARMVAEGYGDKHAVADNATPDGRARNRRIALRVTAK